jgi:hypothetical protein
VSFFITRHSLVPTLILECYVSEGLRIQDGDHESGDKSGHCRDESGS